MNKIFVFQEQVRQDPGRGKAKRSSKEVVKEASTLILVVKVRLR